MASDTRTCELCGSAVRLASSGEGTNSYIPLATPERLKEVRAEVDIVWELVSSGTYGHDAGLKRLDALAALKRMIALLEAPE